MSRTGEERVGAGARARPGPAPRRARQGTVLVITGIAGFIIAILILTRPPAALDAEVHLLGSYMVLSGLLRIGRAQVGDGMALVRRVIHGVLGTLVLVAGVVAVVHPPGQLSAWVTLIAIAWVLEAAVILTGSTFSVARGLTLIAAVLCVCIAVALVSYPVIGVGAATASSAVFLVLFSAAQLFEGILVWLPPRYETIAVGGEDTPHRRR
ncbi:DUF308 domain-containing protein [Curtobacterium sp. MCLR17_043]|uniref:DUF308 domain-containing protein n=1 Tax=Curtobacterium sp. MCLR17_043 TaxID=2175627 RepID=UPI0015E8CA01|nr:DUF308 domain-containing protein [Curtobacterium sp. MCLR17_043]